MTSFKHLLSVILHDFPLGKIMSLSVYTGLCENSRPFKGGQFPNAKISQNIWRSSEVNSHAKPENKKLKNDRHKIFEEHLPKFFDIKALYFCVCNDA